MTASDTSPGEGHESDGESGSIDEELVLSEIVEIDRHADRAATVAVRADRQDLLDELTEHLEEIAEWIDDYGGSKIEEAGADE
ncbi:hypothetical protein [Halobacterium sp. KA-6]|uniref:hypothetical protein n=1 Tax=Halobacterium sp. KA-6 TaxID=2896368 RepID=UPI001E472018|nr:hypothetical protein [Halobacterium sp. KA-6]MCD2205310.1 hypothetical protein [Halobacterium sp. KA-6]